MAKTPARSHSGRSRFFVSGYKPGVIGKTAYGCMQAALAEQSGATLRSIQMYEQRRKDINKASAETLYRIAKTLGCTIEDLIEK